VAVNATGTMTFSNATGEFGGGLTVEGAIEIGFGNSEISGAVNLTGAGRTTVANSGVVIFHDEFVHNGAEVMAQDGTAVYFQGTVSGAGAYSGNGTFFFQGDLSPGNSPVIQSMGNTILASTNTLTMEIGGLMPGAGGFNQLDFSTNTVTYDGALVISLINSFTPVQGQSFELFDFSPAFASGTFASFNTNIGGGLFWKTSQHYTNGIVTVVPEPFSAVLLGVGAAAIALLRRRLR